MDKTDNVFKREIGEKFSFNSEVASVFDDMLTRSIPHYWDNIALISKLIQKRKNKVICDLGCSTGNLLSFLSQNLEDSKLIGVDNSPDMLAFARQKSSANIEFVEADILDFEKNADIFIANYTFQFIRPPQRAQLARKIFDLLPQNGTFFMSEKLISDDKELEQQLIEIYYDFKQEQGYSDMEIAKKREALENILIPYSQSENLELLKNAGFRAVEVVFRYANFATFIAIK